MQKSISNFLENVASKRTGKIIAVSEYDRRIALERMPVKESQVVTIHNGMKDIAPEWISSPEKSDPVNITMIARMDDQKDHMTLIRALSGLGGYHLNLVGDGPGTRQLSEEIKRLGMSSHVTFHGRLDSVAGILKESQVFTLISNWEGFPRSTIEAMRAGLPVVVSDVGGASEAVLEGPTGYVVPKGDDSKLREKLRELIKRPDLRKKMGMEARQRYEKHFRFESMFDKTFNCIRKF